MRLVPIVLLLTGCANLTPADLRETEAFRYTLKGNPQEVARCIQKNVENYDGLWSAEIRGNEVFIRIQGQVMGLAELEPAAGNTTTRLYLGRTYPRGEVAARYVNGC